MAQPKKNQINQVLFVMVDSVDFVSIRSALTNPPTGRAWGVNHGVSTAAASVAISKTISHVRSGIYRATIKAAENNFDFGLLRFIQPSCADQIIPWGLVDNDDSDIMSMLTAIQSDFQSRVPKLVATASGVSDALSKAQSDLRSLITTTGAGLSTSALSDVASAVWRVAYATYATTAGSMGSLMQKGASGVSDIQSYLVLMSDVLSDFYSDFQSRVPKLVATNSQMSDALSKVQSDLRSFVGTTGVVLTSAMLSDLTSAVWGAKYTANSAASSFGSLMSDIYSRAGGAVTASDISDIASAVWAHTVGVRVDSVVVGMSDMLSDFYSDFQSRVPKAVATSSGVSDALSKAQSDLRSLITTTGAGLNASALSDIASAVWRVGYATYGTTAGSMGSMVRQTASAVSDVYSLLSDVSSDLTVMSGVLSDTYSAAAQANSRALATFEVASDIYSLLSDVSSDLGIMSDVQSDIFALLSSLESDIQSRFPATIPELTGDPGATPTWAQAEALQFMWLRNNSKTTPSKRFLRNNAGTTVLSATMAETASESFVQGKLG